VVETYGEAAPETVRDQVERVLSLDMDGSDSRRLVSEIPWWASFRSVPGSEARVLLLPV
jgi:hypothetical protein